MEVTKIEKFYSSKRHLFRITILDVEVKFDLDNLIKNMLVFINYNKETELPKFKIVGDNEFIIFEYSKPFRVKISEFLMENIIVNKIPFKKLYDSISYYNIKEYVLNELINNYFLSLINLFKFC